MEGYFPSLIDSSLAVAANQKATKVSNSLTGARIENAEDAAKEFEAMFLAQMLRPMFATVEVDETFGGAESEEMWRDIMVDEYGKLLSDRGGLGIAENLKREFLRLQEVN